MTTWLEPSRCCWWPGWRRRARLVWPPDGAASLAWQSALHRTDTDGVISTPDGWLSALAQTPPARRLEDRAAVRGRLPALAASCRSALSSEQVECVSWVYPLSCSGRVETSRRPPSASAYYASFSLSSCERDERGLHAIIGSEFQMINSHNRHLSTSLSLTGERDIHQMRISIFYLGRGGVYNKSNR